MPKSSELRDRHLSVPAACLIARAIIAGAALAGAPALHAETRQQTPGAQSSPQSGDAFDNQTGRDAGRSKQNAPGSSRDETEESVPRSGACPAYGTPDLELIV